MDLTWPNFQDDDEKKNPPELMAGLTPGTSQQTAPVQTPLPDSNHGMSAALPSKSAQPEPIVTQKAPDLPQAPLPGMPPDIGINDFQKYLSQQKSAIDRFGPEQQMELQNNLVNSRNSLGYKTTDALKGFSDALMQGVAGAGNPNNQARFEDQEQRIGEQQLGTMRGAHEQKLQDLNRKMQLDSQDPQSSLSKSYQKAYASTLSQLGASPQQISAMPASIINDVTSGKIELQKALAELNLQNMWHMGDLNVKQQGIDVAKEGRDFEEKKMKLEHPIMSAVSEMLSGDKGGGEEPSSAAGPYGATVNRNGKVYQWSPITKQYHPAGR